MSIFLFKGYTALKEAVYGGHIDVMKYLINHGADVNKGIFILFTLSSITKQKGEFQYTYFIKHLHLYD